MNTLRCTPASVAVLVMLLVTSGTAHAQRFPSKVVRIVVPTTAGGGLDLTARLIAQELQNSWSQGVIVENRAGGGGTIGIDLVAKATPDGHTMGFFSSTFTANAAVHTNAPYDSLRDFQPVTLVVFSAWVLAVPAALPVRTVKDLMVYAKENPGQVNYASTGSGGGVHLATELLNRMAGLNMIHVPYKGAAPGLIDMISGRVAVTITGLTSAMPHVNAGKLRLLAVTSKKRSPLMPELPAIGESVPGYAYDNWFGVVSPRATPKDIVVQLHGRITGALRVPEVRQRLAELGLEAVGSSSAQFGELIRQEISNYTKLAKDIGARVD